MSDESDSRLLSGLRKGLRGGASMTKKGVGVAARAVDSAGNAVIERTVSKRTAEAMEQYVEVHGEALLVLAEDFDSLRVETTSQLEAMAEHIEERIDRLEELEIKVQAAVLELESVGKRVEEPARAVETASRAARMTLLLASSALVIAGVALWICLH